jgi:hypothetical protein
MRFAVLSGLLGGSFFFVSVTLIESEPTAHAAEPMIVTLAPAALRSDAGVTGTAASAATGLPEAMKETLDNPDVLDGTGPVDDGKDAAPTALARARAALAQSSAPMLSRGEVCSRLLEVARANALPVGFLTNLIWRESRFDHDAISPAGAMGIAQFMPDVADTLGLDAFDARDALPASGRLLNTLRARFNNLGLAAAAYNAGPKRVVDWLAQRATLPKETRDYVSIITGRPIEQWVGKVRAIVFSVPRQVPCHQSVEFTAVEQAERAAQQRRLAEEQRELERERAAARAKRKHRLVTAARGRKAAPQTAASGTPTSRPVSLRTSDKRPSIRKRLRAA